MSGLVAPAMKKTVPVHRLSWIYLFGGVAGFLFAIQLGTGALLMLYYQPTETSAYASVVRIMTEVPYGWLIRSIHVWGASLFVAAVGLHFLTVLLTRSYRKPRELTWVSGMFLLFFALGFGFSGYLLPWNELSYYATLVGTQIPGTVPVVGEFLLHLLRGGDQVTGDTLTRFYAAHVMFLPLILALFLAVHLALVQVQGMSLPLGMRSDGVRDHRPFFGEFLPTELGLWLLILGMIVTLSVLLPAKVGVEADPLKPAPRGIKPEWYFLFLFQTLKQVPETVGVLFFTLMGAFLLLIPFIDRRAIWGEKSRWLFFIVLALLAYAATFETMALFAPGISHPPEELQAESYDWSGGVALLVLMWIVIAYLVYYLRELSKVNAHLRWLYRHSPEAVNLQAGHTRGISD